MNVITKLRILILLLLGYWITEIKGQTQFQYDASAENPYGLPNTEMPVEFLDYAPMIGESDCKSVSRIDQNTWADTVHMTWRFKYIMNGMAVQDESLKEDGKNAGSIRQYIADSARWFVHYYSSVSPTAALPAWEGNKKENGDIVLYNDQPAPNGTPGNFKITFYNISNEGFDWLGEWVTKNESFSYPTWKIYCKKK